VALVNNPSTGHASPQFHVVFDDDFTTVPYMEAGNIPPNWEDLVTNSSEKSTPQALALTQAWLRKRDYDVSQDTYTDLQLTDDPLLDPYAIVTAFHLEQTPKQSAYRLQEAATEISVVSLQYGSFRGRRFDNPQQRPIILAR
jgi:hypothetical protein